MKDLTTKWYGEMIQDESLMEALWVSIKIGVITAIASTIFGFLAAKAMTRRSRATARTASGRAKLADRLPAGNWKVDRRPAHGSKALEGGHKAQHPVRPAQELAVHMVSVPGVLLLGVHAQ